jgi:hypothetical protein
MDSWAVSGVAAQSRSFIRLKRADVEKGPVIRPNFNLKEFLNCRIVAEGPPSRSAGTHRAAQKAH